MLHYWMDRGSSKGKVSTRPWLVLLLLFCVTTVYFFHSEKIINSVKENRNHKEDLQKHDVPSAGQVKPLQSGTGGGSFQRAVDHYISGLDNSTRSFSYVVFSDPQIGLYDMMHAGDGSKWNHDLENMQKFSRRINSLDVRPDFIFCAGDLTNAFPYKEVRFQSKGFLPFLRPRQTADLKEVLVKYFDNKIPMFTVPGNHDLSENTHSKHISDYEKTWGQSYFHFWNGGRVFIALETQLFRSNSPETVILRLEQIEWLKKLFATLPRDTPKTLFQHVPLFMKDSKERDSGDTLPRATIRPLLLRMFCKNNVNIIFSGHTHIASVPKPYKCPEQAGRQIQQVVLTSIVTPFRGDEPSYTLASVGVDGKTKFEAVTL